MSMASDYTPIMHNTHLKNNAPDKAISPHIPASHPMEDGNVSVVSLTFIHGTWALLQGHPPKAAVTTTYSRNTPLPPPRLLQGAQLLSQVFVLATVLPSIPSRVFMGFVSHPVLGLLKNLSLTLLSKATLALPFPCLVP